MRPPLTVVALLSVVCCVFASNDDLDFQVERCLSLKDIPIDFGLAMHGYDPFKADALNIAGNPGIMNGEIFDYDCNFGTGYHNFISFRSDLNCEASMKTKAFTTVKEYSKEISGESQSSMDVEVSVSGGAFGFEAEASAKYAQNRESSHNEALQALNSAKGEVFVTKATCYTHDVSIDTFSRIRFSQNFINGLMDLYDTIGQNVTEQMKVFKPFVETFGTHYIKKAELGASLTYQKVFQGRSKSRASQQQRSACMDKSAGGCVGASYQGAVASVSAKACVNTNMKKCQTSEGANSNEIEDSVASISIVSRGSRPKKLDEWLKSNFNPLPVNIHSEPWIKLLTTGNLELNLDYGFDKTLDPAQLRPIVLNGYKLYCTQILGLSQPECAKKLTGCGQVGSCDYKELCINDPSKPEGYRCEKQKPPSSKFCWGEFVTGDAQGVEVKIQGANWGTCLKKCVEMGGTYLTVRSDANTTTFFGVCHCEKGRVSRITTSATGYKTTPVGLCSDCYNEFQEGLPKNPVIKPNSKAYKKTPKQCAHWCSAKGATFCVIDGDFHPTLDKYNGECTCRYGKISQVEDTDDQGDDLQYRTAALFKNCNNAPT